MFAFDHIVFASCFIERIQILRYHLLEIHLEQTKNNSTCCYDGDYCQPPGYFPFSSFQKHALCFQIINPFRKQFPFHVKNLKKFQKTYFTKLLLFYRGTLRQGCFITFVKTFQRKNCTIVPEKTNVVNG